MNRRDFTRGLMSLSAVPALPLQAVAATTATAAPAASASHMYFMGWYTARMNKTCSPDMLVSKLKVEPDVAREIFGKLVANRTVSPPDALGISRTIDPLPRRIRPGSRVISEKLDEVKTRARERLGEMLEAEGSETVPEEASVDTVGEALDPEAPPIDT